MKRTARLLAAPAIAAIILAGCSAGGADEDAPSPDTSAQTNESDAGGEEKSSGEIQAEHAEENSAAAPMDDGGGDDSSYELVGPGEWGHFSSIGMELPKGEGEIDVQVSEFKCGVTSIPDAVDNPVYMESGGEEGEPNIAAEPEDGKEFCIFTMAYENVGAGPYQVDDPGAVILEDGTTHAQSSEDQDISWTIQDYVIDLNPGDTGEYKHVVSIPAGSAPMALLYPGESAVLESTLALEVE